MDISNIFFYLPKINHTCSYIPLAFLCTTQPEIVERLKVISSTGKNGEVARSKRK